MDVKNLITKINELTEDKYVEGEEIDIDNLGKIIENLDYEEDFRLKAFNFYYIKFEEGVVEFINKLFIMFLLSKSKLIESFIIRICRDSIIPFNLKLELAKNFEHYDISRWNYTIIIFKSCCTLFNRSNFCFDEI